VREGAQWDFRKKITNTAKLNWPEWSTILEEELPEKDFLNLMGDHAFVLCSEGGGLDPSPKAWQAILHRSIPIIRKNALYEAYRHLPVAFVDDWGPNSVTLDKLRKWRAELIEHYDMPDKRAETLRRLSLDYWWDQINNLQSNE
jgi:hypothetical protein